MIRRVPLFQGLAVAIAVASFAAVPSSAGNVAGTSCPAFLDNSWWHADVSKLPLQPRSDEWMSHMSPASNLHPDFGKAPASEPAPYGIPITVVSSSHEKVRVRFDIAPESDHVRYPLGLDI